jgi:hypothetical protein
MRINRLRDILFIMIGFFLMSSCSGNSEAPPAVPKVVPAFQADSLTIKDSDSVKKIRGQVLYVPIYSNIPCRADRLYDLSAFIAIHNTDVHNSIRVTKVLYFNNDGKLVSDFLKREIPLAPMGATNFHVPKQDKSGTGANFLVEWRSDAQVSEPLIESVMMDCETHRGISFLSRGKIIREIR